MPVIMETTVHDMKTHFSKYSAGLIAGEYDEIIVKNRTTPALRVLRYEQAAQGGLKFGAARERGHMVVSPDWDMNAGDDEIAEMFAGYF